MSYNKKKKPAQAAAPGDTLPEETKTQIKTFKEMFPKYKSSTNDDILAVFAEFNNNFEAAVYGVMNSKQTPLPLRHILRRGVCEPKIVNGLL